MEAALNLYPTPLNEQEQRARLKLIRTETIGPITFHTLIKKFGSAVESLKALPELARKGGRLKPLVAASDENLDQEWRCLEKFGGRFVFYGHSDYPKLLSYLDDAPPVLAVKGRLNLFQEPSLSMVGSRNASLNGRHLAKDLAIKIGKAGYVLTSGLARGIDTSAHEGALEFGTIAVMAGGLNVIYPLENKNLYEKISGQGLLIAESAFGVAPTASSFPRRNRLISGLSRGVIVIEAALKSGSLITAQYANEQNRDVFAVPGSPLDPRCQGANSLIQEGAILIQNVEDIFKNLQPEKRMAPHPDKILEEGNFKGYEDPPHEVMVRKIKENLSFSPLHIDELMRECHFSPAKVHLLLLEMEVAGSVCRHPGHQVSLKIESTE